MLLEQSTINSLLVSTTFIMTDYKEQHLKTIFNLCHSQNDSKAKAVTASHGSTSYTNLPSKLQLAALGKWCGTVFSLIKLSFQIVVEGIKGQGEGVIGLDDVQVTNYPCTPSGQCDFEANFCSWLNLLEVDDADWLRVQAGTGKHTGPSVDHTSNSSTGEQKEPISNTIVLCAEY